MKPILADNRLLNLSKGVLTITAFIATLILVDVALAQSYSIGQPMMKGTGCPTGSVSAIVSPDGAELSLLFDSFAVEGRQGPNPFENLKKSCQFRIPISIPQGYNLEALQMDYRGFGNLLNGNRAIIMTAGPLVNKSAFLQPDSSVRVNLDNVVDNFTITQPIQQNFSNVCQGQKYIDFNTTVQVMGPQASAPQTLSQDSSVVIDSADIAGGQAVRIRFRPVKCGGLVGPTPTPPGPTPTPTSGQACFYEHANYQGAALCLPAGSKINNLGGALAGKISSIRIFGQLQVTISDAPNLAGRKLTTTKSMQNLAFGPNGMNDRTVSIDISL